MHFFVFGWKHGQLCLTPRNNNSSNTSPFFSWNVFFYPSGNLCICFNTTDGEARFKVLLKIRLTVGWKHSWRENRMNKRWEVNQLRWIRMPMRGLQASRGCSADVNRTRRRSVGVAEVTEASAEAFEGIESFSSQPRRIRTLDISEECGWLG